ncbi:MAG: lytic transglycosylase domain-containing protein [Maritimibacter sp.]|nr:lytic transglycosylase domain-containing protein [Maritimibacter sp.]
MRGSFFPTLVQCACAVALACGLAPAPARAETAAAPVYPDFTFRRVVAPPAGQGPKISVQIDPAAQAAFIASRPKPAERAPTPEPSTEEMLANAAAANGTADASAALPTVSGWEWFWSGVSPALSSSGPANVARALAVLDEADSLPSPRLQALQDIAKAHGRDILAATVGTDVSPALVLALISVESSGKATAESHKGAQGLMQLIPDTAARFGVEDATDPVQNIKGGVAYLEWLMKKFDSDPILALAGYNAGENAVVQNNGVPPYAETRAYVPKVLAAWRVARGLCMTPPELVTDACVFAVQG